MRQLFILICFWPVLALGQQFEFRSSDPGGADAIVWSIWPDSIFAHTPLTAAATSWNNMQGKSRILIRFNLDSLPPGKYLREAHLSLYTLPNTTGHYGNNSSIIQRVVSPWQANELSWHAMPYTTPQFQVLTAAVSGSQHLYHINITQLIRHHYTFPDSNFGLMIRLENETPFSLITFSSAEFTSRDFHPQLTLTLDSLPNSLPPSPPPPPKNPIVFQIRTSTGQGSDAVVYNLMPDSSFGNHPLRIETGTSNDDIIIRRSYLKFDLSSLPAGFKVTNAKLSLFSNPEGNGHSGYNVSYLLKLLSPWTDSTITWNNQPQYTSDSLIMTNFIVSGYHNLNQVNLTKLAQMFYTYPDSNHGILFRKQHEIPYGALSFLSSSYPDAKFHPLLEVALDTVLPLSQSLKPELTVPQALLYPNPARQSFTFSLEEGEINLTALKIYDLYGRLMPLDYEAIDNGSIQIATSNWVNGIYLLQYGLANQPILSKRLLVQQ